ncbi:MAG: hypothetical protein K2Y22_17145 [Candidatus Obscuribacterales bacterium]|nr:hypothetical protein [Candidatus Obscuribacterales bacterium]
MSAFSTLLILDGSAECLQAAELLWKVGVSQDIGVDAQFVVDSPGIWEFLSFDVPGLIGSGPYLKVHEAVRQELLSLGDTLAEMYSVHSGSLAIKGDVFIDEGNPVREICSRARSYSLTAIGNKSSGITSPAQDRRAVPRRSLAEKLAHYIESPLLIIQNACTPWQSLDVYIDPADDFQNTLDGAFFVASFLNAQIRVVPCIDQPHNQTGQAGLLNYLQLQRENFPQVTVELISADTMSVIASIASRTDITSLPVISSFAGPKGRHDPVGLLVDQTIRYLSVPSILLWPAEFSLRKLKEQPAATNRNKAH